MKRLLVIVLIVGGCERKPAVVYQGQPEAYWVERTHSGDPATKIEGAKALAHFKDEQSTGTLRSMLGDGNTGTRYYAAESLWYASRSTEVVPALRSVIRDPLGWSYRDRLLLLLKDMGDAAKPLAPDIEKAIDDSPNSRVAKWQECLNVIPR